MIFPRKHYAKNGPDPGFWKSPYQSPQWRSCRRLLLLELWAYSMLERLDIPSDVPAWRTHPETC